MPLRIEPAADRRALAAPLMAGGFGLLAATVLAGLWMRGADVPRLCALRAATGLPCPACGGTRATLALLSGAPLAALHYNPLVALALPGLASLLALRLLRRKRIVWRSGLRRRRVFLALFLLALLANEAWLISAGT